MAFFFKLNPIEIMHNSLRVLFAIFATSAVALSAFLAIRFVVSVSG